MLCFYHIVTTFRTLFWSLLIANIQLSGYLFGFVNLKHFNIILLRIESKNYYLAAIFFHAQQHFYLIKSQEDIYLSKKFHVDIYRQLLFQTYRKTKRLIKKPVVRIQFFSPDRDPLSKKTSLHLLLENFRKNIRSNFDRLKYIT